MALVDYCILLHILAIAICPGSFFKKFNNGIMVVKLSEKRGIGAMDGEGQARNTDNIYQPVAARR